MAKELPQYIFWRDGRPRFIPGEGARKLGFAGQDLKQPDGAWMSFEQAEEWGRARYREILAARASGKRAAVQPVERGDSVEDLLDDFLDAMERGEPGPDGKPLSPDAIESYRKSARAVIYQPETRAQAAARRDKERAAALLGLDPPERERELFARKPVSVIGKIELNNFYLYLKRVRGHHMALAAVAVFSAAYTWGGLSPKWRLGSNPRHALTFSRPQGRIVVYSDAEIRALMAAGDAIERPSVGDSIFLGLFTSQRQRDRLTLKDEGLIDGRRQIRQSKTGRLVPVKETAQLAARLAAARLRVAALCLKLGLRPEHRPETIVVDETTGRPYVQNTYRTVFGLVRLVAAHGLLDGETLADVTARAARDAAAGLKPGERLYNTAWRLPPCPSLAGKWDMDLRDTAVTWLARAGCTMAEICAISGHSEKSVQTIIKHYLGAARELADQGIDKLTAWMTREGIAV